MHSGRSGAGNLADPTSPLPWRRDLALFVALNIWLLPLLVWPRWLFAFPVMQAVAEPGASEMLQWTTLVIAFALTAANARMNARIHFRHPFFLIGFMLWLHNSPPPSLGVRLVLYGPEGDGARWHTMEQALSFPVSLIVW